MVDHVKISIFFGTKRRGEYNNYNSTKTWPKSFKLTIIFWKKKFKKGKLPCMHQKILLSFHKNVPSDKVQLDKHIISIPQILSVCCKTHELQFSFYMFTWQKSPFFPSSISWIFTFLQGHRFYCNYWKKYLLKGCNSFFFFMTSFQAWNDKYRPSMWLP